jgi:glycosyltransferase involved in cell wall biosynthesis
MRLRLNIWSPWPPSASGVADYAAEQAEALHAFVDVHCVSEDAADVPPPADLDLYHVGNSPPHGRIYRQALARSGVVLLHDWSLHHLVLSQTLEAGDVGGYLREMRRAHGEAGTFVGRQVARGLGGSLLPALYPVNDRLLDASLAIVALTQSVANRASLRLPGRPVLALPHHLSLPLDPPPTRSEARRALGIAEGSQLVVAPGLATASKRLDVALAAISRLRPRHPKLQMIVAGSVDPQLPLASWAQGAGLGDALRITGRLSLEDFERFLAAADVVIALRFPSHGEMSGALVRALGVGRPVLVTAGTPAADEFPEGIVITVDPGRAEAAELEAILARLLADDTLAGTLGRLARAHVTSRHALPETAERLAGFLEEVASRRASLARVAAESQPPDGSLRRYLLDEVRWSAHDLGLSGLALGLEPLLAPLMDEVP